jgi:hypothetical protein
MTPPSSRTDQPDMIGTVDLKTLAEVLIKREGLHEGYFAIAMRVNVAIATFAFGPESDFGPGALTTVSAVGLREVPAADPLAVNAALVNPKARTKDSAKPKPASKPARKLA